MTEPKVRLTMYNNYCNQKPLCFDLLFVMVSSYGWYFTFIQGFVYLGLVSWHGFRPKHIINPWKTYIKLSAVLMGSHGLTKGSLMFLNYPAQIMFKSTKVLLVFTLHIYAY